MVNWDTVKRPVIEGGLHIRDSRLVNLAMGGKLLWQIFSNKKHPVSQFFWKKYLKGGTLRNLQMPNTPKGTTIWNLCRKCLDFFTHQLFRIPGNDNFFLWDDKIKGNDPLNSDPSIEIKFWLVNKGFLRLSDISSWDRKGNWATWVFPALPDHGYPLLHSEFNSLLTKLIGLALIHSSCKGVWGWGSAGIYLAAFKYQSLQTNHIFAHNPNFWKTVWQSPSIPKVNFFTWILMHQRALTSENLLKIGFFGPFRCCFCK